MPASLVSPQANYSNSRFGAVKLDTLHTLLAETDGLVFCADAEDIPGAIVTSEIAGFNESAQGRPFRANLGTRPTLAQSSQDNNRLSFDMSAITECSMTLQEDHRIAQDGTLIFHITPTTATTAAANNSFIFSTWDANVRLMGAYFTLSHTLLLNDEHAGGGLEWTYGSRLANGVPAIIALQWSNFNQYYAIYCNDGRSPAAQSGNNQAVGNLFNSRLTLFGARDVNCSLRCRASKAAYYNRLLSTPELTALMDAYRDYFAVPA